MKNKFILRSIWLPVLFFFSILQGYSQINLQDLINGNNGTSKHFITLKKEQQFNFDHREASRELNLDHNSDLVLESADSGKSGRIYYRYYQTYRGIPIENSMYIIHTQDSKLTGLHGSIVVKFAKEMNVRAAAINEVKAIGLALNHVHAQKYAWQDANMESRIKLRTGKANTSYYPVPTLVWYNPGDSIEPAKLRLSYKVDIYSVKPFDRNFIFIDAVTGKVLGIKPEMMNIDATGTANTAYSGAQVIHSDLNGTSYRLRDLVKGNGIITLNAGNLADYNSATANWTLAGADQYALDAHYGAEQTWLFYKNNFNRNSIDNHGYALRNWVNDGNDPLDAHWDGNEMDYGNLQNGQGITSIDVAAHELTHGVTQYTSQLNYSNESGAIDESMSDIMGKSVQFWSKPADVNWQVGNDMNYIVRSMSNPKAYGQPNTYKKDPWYTGSDDFGGVHKNSGVGNFMFYLLVTGGCSTNDYGNAYNVTGIGLTAADQIIYLTETSYLTPNSQYADWRNACISAASNLYGTNSFQVTQVENAWYAVGIGTPGTVTISGPTDVCSTAQYSIVGLPANAVVNWAISPSYATLSLSPATGLTTTVTNRNFFQVSTSLNATISIPGACTTLASSLPIAAATSGLTGVINQGVCFNTEFINNGSLFTNGNANVIYNNCPATISLHAPGANSIQCTLASGIPGSWVYIPSTNTLNLTLNSSPVSFNIVSGGGCGQSTILFVPGLPGGASITTQITSGAGRGLDSSSIQSTPFKIYPNPATSSVVIVAGELDNIRQIKIYDAAGAFKRANIYSNSTKEVQLNVSDLEPGIYLLEISNGNTHILKKLIVLH
jgi:bacillolysin